MQEPTGYDDGKTNLQQRIHQYTTELHSALDTMRVGGQKPPPGDRPMTFEEKRKLSIAIGRLPGDSLFRVLQIVGEDPKYAVCTNLYLSWLGFVYVDLLIGMLMLAFYAASSF